MKPAEVWIVATVQDVIGADLLRVRYGDREELFRLAGVHTAGQSAGKRINLEVAREAREFVSENLRDRQVRILTSSVVERDLLGRRLAFIQYDGKDLGEELILEGFCRYQPETLFLRSMTDRYSSLAMLDR